MLNKIIISGGGTGGHIFPAVAIADTIKKKYPNADILFVGAKGKMEMQKVPQAGYKIVGLNIAGLQRSLSISNFTLPFKIMSSIYNAYKLLKNEKPQVVIGTGGFASAPVLYMATALKIPTVIQEQNSLPGKVNTFLGKRVNNICAAYTEVKQYFPAEKVVMTGNPIREQIEFSNITKEAACKEFGLDQNKKTVLVYGGSLGALAINQGMMNAFEKLNQSDIQIIWQTGSHFYPQTEQLRKLNSNNIKIVEFINNMEVAYAAADLVVSRAGAIALSEICLKKKASILVPLPTAAEDHQTKNAMALVNLNAAILLKNSEAPKELGNIILETINQKQKLDILSENAGKAAFPRSAEKIVEVIENLVNGNA